MPEVGLEKEGCTLIGPWCSRIDISSRRPSYLDEYCPCAGGLSVVNTISTSSENSMEYDGADSIAHCSSNGIRSGR